MEINIVKLKRQFYLDNSDKKELLDHDDLQKGTRRKYLLRINLGISSILIPFRSNIVLGRDRDIKKGFISPVAGKESAGLSFEKLIILKNDSDYILSITSLDREVPETQARNITRNIEKITNSLKNYLTAYKKMYEETPEAVSRHFLFRYSTLQYFHKELGLEKGKVTKKEKDNGLL